VFAFLAGAFDAKEIFDARHRIAQNAVRVIQFRAALQRELTLGFAGVNEIIWMELPAELQKFLLKSAHLDPELAGQTKQLEIAGIRGHR